MTLDKNLTIILEVLNQTKASAIFDAIDRLNGKVSKEEFFDAITQINEHYTKRTDND